MKSSSILAILAMTLLAGAAACLAQDAPAGDSGSSAAQPEADQPTTQPEDEAEEASAFAVWRDKLVGAGWTIVALALLSIIGVALVLERLFGLRRSVVVPAGLGAVADKLWREGKFKALEQAALVSNSTLGRVLAFVVEHRSAPSADLSMLAGDVAARDLRRHQQRAYGLAVIGTLAPLLGLLGTVSGMVEAFDKIAMAGEMGDVTLLGGSISKALITTLVGLVVAIPALGFYHFFKSRTNSLYVDLEEEATELISGWTLKSTPPAETTPPIQPEPVGKEA